MRYLKKNGTVLWQQILLQEIHYDKHSLKGPVRVSA